MILCLRNVSKWIKWLYLKILTILRKSMKLWIKILFLIWFLTLFNLRIPFNFHSSIVSLIVSTKCMCLLIHFQIQENESFTIWCLISKNELSIHLKTFLWLRAIGTYSIKKTVFNKSHWQTGTFSFIFWCQGLDLKILK